MSTPVVEIRGLRKSFGKQEILRGLDWQIERGQIVGLLGRNGAGKSTLMECLLGLREFDGGEVRVFGEPAGKFSDATRARIGYVPQTSDLFDWLTPLQMFDYFRRLYPRWNERRVAELLQRWDITDELQHQTIARLSLGQKQRLSIIRAMAHEPQLLVLDEPVAALDPFGRRAFLREVIACVMEQEASVIFSTHILSDLERVAMDVAFLRDGDLALKGSLDSLLEGARRISGPLAALAQLALPVQFRAATGEAGIGSVVAQLSAEEAAQLERAHPALHVETMNLEELFVEVTH